MAEKKGLMVAVVNRLSKEQELKKEQQLWEDIVYDPELWDEDIELLVMK